MLKEYQINENGVVLEHLIFLLQIKERNLLNYMLLVMFAYPFSLN